ncbi:hypothetical protein DER72_103130 [Halomonas sp. A11-A]|nr:hypothetical protein DER72_103130 [Halomonas sp. A11-A]
MTGQLHRADFVPPAGLPNRHVQALLPQGEGGPQPLSRWPKCWASFWRLGGITNWQ